MKYATTNPYTGKTLKIFPDATDAEVKQAIEKAHEAFLAWKETSFAERGRILQKAADILRRDADAYARLLTLEMGKVFSEAKAEVELSAKIFEYYVRNAEQLLKPEKLPVLDSDEGKALMVYEPLGVLLAIEPWNFPVRQPSDQSRGGSGLRRHPPLRLWPRAARSRHKRIRQSQTN
jgi:succinate-semialdehyde dehydrogenase / glutarate-semialdehyde dehydrogenase